MVAANYAKPPLHLLDLYDLYGTTKEFIESFFTLLNISQARDSPPPSQS
jgi:hypothetical protein